MIKYLIMKNSSSPMELKDTVVGYTNTREDAELFIKNTSAKFNADLYIVEVREVGVK